MTVTLAKNETTAVTTRVLNHPGSLAWVPGGDMLITE